MAQDSRPDDAPGWAGPDGSQGPAPSAPPPAPVPPGVPTAPAPPPGWGGPQQPAWGAPQGWGGPAQAARPGVVPLRPLGLGELLDGAVSVVRRYPRPSLGLSAVVAVLSTVLNIGLMLLLPVSTLGGGGGEDPTTGELGAGVASLLGQVVIAVLVGIVLTGVITSVIGKAVLGQPFTTGQAWAQVRPLLGRLLGVTLLTGLLISLAVAVPVVLALVIVSAGGDGLLLLGVPLGIAGVAASVYLFVRFALAAPALVLERSGVRDALRRSNVLVRDSFWRTLGVLLLTQVIVQVVSGFLQAPFLFLNGLDGDVTRLGQVVSAIGAGIALTITAPFSSGVTALLYIDRRIRSEGLDVALAASAAQAGQPDHGGR